MTETETIANLAEEDKEKKKIEAALDLARLLYKTTVELTDLAKSEDLTKKTWPLAIYMEELMQTLTYGQKLQVVLTLELVNYDKLKDLAYEDKIKQLKEIILANQNKTN